MSGRWLLRPLDPDAEARVFCFPYPGVGASMYAAWPGWIGPAQVCLVQPPGRENRLREPHYGDYETLAEQFAEYLTPYLDRPFAFFGHCGGAMPGFATAVRLAELGLPMPAVLFVSSHVAPHDGPYGRFLAMTDAQLSTELEALVLALGGTPHPDLIALGLNVLRADLEATRRYRLAEPIVLPGAITALGWSGDRDVTVDLMGGWPAYAGPGRYRQVVLDGSHYEFLSAPDSLLAELAADMERAVVEAGEVSAA